MSPIAILDLGTNTFHLLIVQQNPNGKFKILHKSKMASKLGEGGINTNIIAPQAFDRGISILKHFKATMTKHGVVHYKAIATSAIRSSSNKNLFLKAAKNIGITLSVIDGNKEANYIAIGVNNCIAIDSVSLIMDIGGGSTEFIITTGKKILWKKSYNIGAARLLAKFSPSNPIEILEINLINNYLDKELKDLSTAIKKYKPNTLIGSSGSFDTFASIIGWKNENKDILKNKKQYTFDMKEYYTLHKVLLKSTLSERKKMKGLLAMRVDMVVLASIFTNYILHSYSFDHFKLSKYALKEGVLFSHFIKQ